MGNHTPPGTPQAGTRVPLRGGLEGASVSPSPRLTVTAGPAGQSEAGSHPSADSDSLFPGAPRDLPEPGGCCPPLCPNPELILQCLLPTETLLGKLRTRGAESIVRTWKKFPQKSGGPGPRTEVPQRKGPSTCFPCLDQCPSAFKPRWGPQHTPSTEVRGHRLWKGQVLRPPPPGSRPCLSRLNRPSLAV